jgi:hypothetical protein
MTRVVTWFLLIATAFVMATHSDSTAITIGAFDFSRAGNRSFAEGGVFSIGRTVAADVLPDAVYLTAPQLTDSFLTQVDILIISAVGGVTAEPISPLTQDEQYALLGFVGDGGALFAFLDNQNYGGSGIESPFGLVAGGVLAETIFAQIVLPGHPVANGIYGQVVSMEQRWPGAFLMVPDEATIVAENSLGPALVVLEQGALAGNSGPCVFASDNNSWNDGVIGANEALFRNILIFLAGRGGPVPTGNATWGNMTFKWHTKTPSN